MFSNYYFVFNLSPRIGTLCRRKINEFKHPVTQLSFFIRENLLLGVRFKKNKAQIPVMFVNFLIVLAFSNLISCDERSGRVKRIVGGIPADAPPADDPVVYARFSGKQAKVRGVRDFPHYVFRGIKYAQPPTGSNRFLVRTCFF